ncbi:glucosaminidase domain-containing protein (plasmid) [Clostridium estertheticum]|uniref:Glucosaminidase domain-containing protein n=1 Tax=Clostridium estertheticum TaxID=238834 RepID=A0AA47EN77_9CLOT|nr:glucosaminidase domain-containing protein [Clostridium estertheticum]MBU3158089.1 glucosaminidase domain-containing protein [Clostridium estertheticum]MBU3201996.1 glucosaminidase domain-containing protein [Clostridium estertheticum]WAG63328.1 glucosaminidase domain-containing protein [Clostridium estertheticum]WAG68233.1 glucosaminidase domain-containing protein [Clostridium estertheticum]
MDKTQIIESLIPGALLTYEKYNILPSLTIAQAILETGWLQYVKGNNIFGIKWTKGCGYEVQEFNTHEFINGVSTPMVCMFRKYDTLGDSILDHGKLLSFSRYKSVITSKNYKEACQNVYSSGYCTDEEYPEKLIAIIEQNKLYLYDCAPRSENTTDEDIKYLQKCLNSMKIKDINNNVLVVDGASGPLTIGTIKKLQQILNLSIDGICGPEVLSGVKTIMEKPLCSIESTEYKTAIRYIQWRTGSAIDGIYGDETVGLVKEYQQTNSLVIDGIVGDGTWQSLLS